MKFRFSDRYCTFCGSKHKKNETCCQVCGRELGDNKYGGMERFGAGGVGYSDRVDDESFKKFKSANKKVGAVILLIMGVMIGGVVLAQGATPLLAGGEVLIVFMIDL